MNLGKRDIFGRQFKPTWRALFLMLVGVCLFASLGQWQLDRADFKQAAKLKFESKLAQQHQIFDPLVNSENASQTKQFQQAQFQDLEYRQILLRGQYLNESVFLLDNKINRGQVGYHVLTPFKLTDSEAVVLVNRGWVGMGQSRLALPEIALPLRDNLIAGTASLASMEGFRMGKVMLTDTWPQVIPYIDIEALQSQYSGQLLPMVLWLSPEQPGHFVRVWQPIWADPDKSKAYAAQWFLFALIAIILFFVLNLRKPNE